MNKLEPAGLTSPEAIKNLIGMVRAEATSWRDPKWNERHRDPVEEAGFYDVIASTLESLATRTDTVKATVKKLEWSESGGQSAALKPFGAWYFVHQKGEEWFIHYGDKQGYPTKEAAKAAAQSDFEARILSSLEVPAHPEGVKAAMKRDSFPPTSCNAWEDCHHDGICHDSQTCGATGPNARKNDV